MKLRIFHHCFLTIEFYGCWIISVMLVLIVLSHSLNKNIIISKKYFTYSSRQVQFGPCYFFFAMEWWILWDCLKIRSSVWSWHVSFIIYLDLDIVKVCSNKLKIPWVLKSLALSYFSSYSVLANRTRDQLGFSMLEDEPWDARNTCWPDSPGRGMLIIDSNRWGGDRLLAWV